MKKRYLHMVLLTIALLCTPGCVGLSIGSDHDHDHTAVYEEACDVA